MARLTEAAAKKRRLDLAADQIWAHIRRGANLEVPFSMKKDDEYLQALVILQKKHPEVQMRLYQSKGIVIGMNMPGVTLNISQEAFAALQKGHAFGVAGKVSAESMLDDHIAWMRSHGFDPEQAEKDAQEAEAKKYRIELTDRADPPKEVSQDLTAVIPSKEPAP